MTIDIDSKIMPDGVLSKTPELTTYFSISGWDLDPESCTSALGLKPSEVWRQKHKHLLDHKDLPSVSWSLGEKNQREFSVSKAVEAVLDLVWPARERVIRFVSGKNFIVGVTCSVTIYEDRPIYDLSKETISRLAVLDCEFCLDIFDYSSTN